MKITVTGIDRAVGRCVADRLVLMGHDVTGVARRRPVGWPGSVDFLASDDREGLRSAARGADAVLAGVSIPEWQVEAFTRANVQRVVALSSTEGPPDGLECVWLRCGLILGRDVDDDVLASLTSPLLFSCDADSPVQVVHPHDVASYAVRCLTEAALTGGGWLIAEGHTTVRAIASAVGRHVIPAPQHLLAEHSPKAADAPDFRPVWKAPECVADFALTARGRIGVGTRVYSLPWRLTRVRDVPAVDVAADDGVPPVMAGIDAASGEFDTPIDPRFPAFVATNLSEALPGPFTPSSASVTVRSARAAGMVIAEHLRPGGMVQREMATRTTGVFGHRLYAGMTSASFMANSVPFVRSEIITTAFFGQIAEGVEVFGEERPTDQRGGFAGTVRALLTFGVNLIGLSLGAATETRRYNLDVTRVEEQSHLVHHRGQAAALDALILDTRDLVVHGWVISSASMLVCTAYGVMLRLACGRDTAPATGRGVASGHSLSAVHRLAAAARADPTAMHLLARPRCGISDLAGTPGFRDRVLTELGAIGHRGPAEMEMQSTSFADDPDMLIGMVAKAVRYSGSPVASTEPGIAWWARPISAAMAAQLRDREVRRDRMVRAIWVLRRLLRTRGAELVAAGRIERADDVFYLQVEELSAAPDDLKPLVAGRRAERQRLSRLMPPPAFSGRWAPAPAHAAVLTGGERLRGLGICGGRVRGRVRVVAAETLDRLQPGEVLVAKVTDIGYTPAFAYAAAVVTELGGPISHAAIVAREYGITCVVNAPEAASRLLDGTMIEVDGASGEVRVLSG